MRATTRSQLCVHKATIASSGYTTAAAGVSGAHQSDCCPARRSASSHRARPTSSPRPSARGATSGCDVTSAVVTASASGMRTRMSPGAAATVVTRPPGAGATPLERSPREAAHSRSSAGERVSTAGAEVAAEGRVRPGARAPWRPWPAAPRTAARRLPGRTPSVGAAHRMRQPCAAEGAGGPQARASPCPTRARHQPGAGEHAAVHSGISWMSARTTDEAEVDADATSDGAHCPALRRTRPGRTLVCTTLQRHHERVRVITSAPRTERACLSNVRLSLRQPPRRAVPGRDAPAARQLAVQPRGQPGHPGACLARQGTAARHCGGSPLPPCLRVL